MKHPTKSVSLLIDGAVIRVVPCRSVHHDLRSCYEIHVDDVLRGWVGYGFGRNRSDPSWRVYVRKASSPSTEHDGVSRVAYDRLHGSGESLIECATAFARLVVEGKAMTEAEATEAVALSNQQEAARRLQRQQEHDNRVALSEAAAAAEGKEVNESVEGLSSIRERFSGQMTNFEMSALALAIDRLGRLAVDTVKRRR